MKFVKFERRKTREQVPQTRGIENWKKREEQEERDSDLGEAFHREREDVSGHLKVKGEKGTE